MNQSASIDQAHVATEGGLQRRLEVTENEATVGECFTDKPKMSMRNVNVFYEEKQAIHDVSWILPKMKWLP